MQITSSKLYKSLHTTEPSVTSEKFRSFGAAPWQTRGETTGQALSF